MGYFPVRYDSRVVISDRKIFIRCATDDISQLLLRFKLTLVLSKTQQLLVCAFFNIKL